MRSKTPKSSKRFAADATTAQQAAERINLFKSTSGSLIVKIKKKKHSRSP